MAQPDPQVSEGRARALLVVGAPGRTVPLVLSRFCKSDQRSKPLIVADYQGLAAGALPDEVARMLMHRRVLWFDLCNRARPVAFWRLRQCSGLVDALQHFLMRAAELMAVPVRASVVHALALSVRRWVGSGTMGLPGLAQCLARSELLGGLQADTQTTQELAAIREMLHGLLRFPLLWAASEGANTLNLAQQHARPTVVWCELPRNHAEEVEHLI